MHVHDWTILGADNQPIIGNTHVPDGEPRGMVIIAHGFKGYKDYGMFPRIAQRLSDAGFIAHRFNFSHSGMTNKFDTFERPDLFERDTWNKQVYDLKSVIEWSVAQRPHKTNTALPYILFGHSRGGVATLLTAGRLAEDASFPQPAGVVTASSPDRCNPLSENDAAQLLTNGYLESPSSRTGQTLRVGKGFLQEQLDEPQQHDVLALASRINCPVLVIHGKADPTVPADAAQRITQAVGKQAELLLIPDGDHVFNTPNPLPDETQESQQFAMLIDAVVQFVRRVTPAQE